MTTQPPPSVETLRLARLTRYEAQARTALAQRVRALPVDWDGQEWLVTLSPMAQGGPFDLQLGEWRLELEWAGANFDMVAPATVAQAWIAARFPTLDIATLSDELAAAVLETACDKLLTALTALGRGPARLMRLQRDPSRAEGYPHRFQVEARCGDQFMVVWLACGPAGLMQMAGLAARLPALRNELPMGDLPVAIRAEIGHTWLPANELEALSPGDAVLIEHVFLGPDNELWLTHADWGGRVLCDTQGLTVTQEFTHLEITMSSSTTDTASTGQTASIDSLPLRLTFDLGDRDMSLAELQSLQVGQVIELAKPLSAAVSLRVSGVLIGTGELVEIDDRLGVCVTALARGERT